MRSLQVEQNGEIEIAQGADGAIDSAAEQVGEQHLRETGPTCPKNIGESAPVVDPGSRAPKSNWPYALTAAQKTTRRCETAHGRYVCSSLLDRVLWTGRAWCVSLRQIERPLTSHHDQWVTGISSRRSGAFLPVAISWTVWSISAA